MLNIIPLPMQWEWKSAAFSIRHDADILFSTILWSPNECVIQIATDNRLFAENKREKHRKTEQEKTSINLSFLALIKHYRAFCGYKRKIITIINCSSE